MGAPPRSTIVRSVTDARYDVVGEPVELVWFVEGGPEDVAIQAQSTVPSGQRLRPVLPAATEAVPVGADGRDHVVDARNGGRVPTGSAAPWSMAARAAGRSSGGRYVLSGDTHPSASWPMARSRRGLRAPTQIDTWWTVGGVPEGGTQGCGQQQARDRADEGHGGAVADAVGEVDGADGDDDAAGERHPERRGAPQPRREHEHEQHAHGDADAGQRQHLSQPPQRHPPPPPRRLP